MMNKQEWEDAISKFTEYCRKVVGIERLYKEEYLLEAYDIMN